MNKDYNPYDDPTDRSVVGHAIIRLEDALSWIPHIHSANEYEEVQVKECIETALDYLNPLFEIMSKTKGGTKNE